MAKHQLTAAEDKLLMRGFDYATDLNAFDPYYDDADVLRQLEIDPNLKAVEISKLTKLSTHRIIAAMMRLKAEGKLPVPPPAIVVEFPETCSKGNIKPPKRSDFDSLISFVVAYREWENENPDQIDPDQLVPGTKIKLSDDSIAEIIDPINPPGCFINAVLNGEKLQVADGDYVVLGEYEADKSENLINLRPKESDKLICSRGNEGSCVNDQTKPGSLVTILDSEGLWKIDSLKDGHAKIDLVEGDRKLPKRRRVAFHNLRIAEPLTTSDDIDNAAKQWGLQFGQQLELKLECEQSQNILLTEPPRQVEANGQLSIFFDNSEEPPDPDDFESLDEYHKQREIWANSHPELEQVMAERIKKIEESKLVLRETSYQFQKGDRIQKTSNPKWVGEIQSISKKGLTVRYSCGFETIHQADELTLFAKANSDSVLGESFFKIGEKVTSDYNFKGKIFTIKSIYPSGMVGLIGESSQVISLPSHWLNHHVEAITSTVKNEPEVTTRKRPQKGCGTGYLMTRAANIKRNAAKGKSPDIYYVYAFSYTNQYGKEIKSSISVPRAKIAQVKQMVENREHYIKIARFLGKSLPMSY